MMGRNAAIEFYGYEYLVSVEGAGANDGIEPDDIFMDPIVIPVTSQHP